MSKQTKHRYLNSFFITTILYLVASFFLFYVFADTLVEEKKPEEVKISIKQMMTQQESTPIQPTSEPISEITPPPEPVVEKKMDKPKKERKYENKHHEHKKHEPKRPIVEKKQEVTEIKSEVTPFAQAMQKAPEKESPTKQQIDSAQTENIEATYLSKIRHLIEKNKTYPKTAKRLNQTGKVYVTFIITKDGRIKNCRIERSSQFDSLDEASLETLMRIASFEAIPEELNKDSWEITVPIVYQIS